MHSYQSPSYGGFLVAGMILDFLAFEKLALRESGSSCFFEGLSWWSGCGRVELDRVLACASSVAVRDSGNVKSYFERQGIRALVRLWAAWIDLGLWYRFFCKNTHDFQLLGDNLAQWLKFRTLSLAWMEWEPYQHLGTSKYFKPLYYQASECAIIC